MPALTDAFDHRSDIAAVEVATHQRPGAVQRRGTEQNRASRSCFDQPSPQEIATVSGATVQGHDQRVRTGVVVVFGHVDGERAAPESLSRSRSAPCICRHSSWLACMTRTSGLEAARKHPPPAPPQGSSASPSFASSASSPRRARDTKKRLTEGACWPRDTVPRPRVSARAWPGRRAWHRSDPRLPPPNPRMPRPRVCQRAIRSP